MAGKAVKICLSLVPFVLLLIASVLAFVGFFGVWGSASFNIAILFQGKGDFTLRSITLHSSILGFELPSETYQIDKTLCSDTFSTPELDEVCQKFTLMQVFTTLTLIFTMVSFAFTILSFFTARPKWGSRLLALAVPIASMILMVASAVFAIVALVVAATLPRNPKGFEMESAAGPASISMAILAVLCLIAAGFELLSCRKGVHHPDESSRNIKEGVVVHDPPVRTSDMFEPGRQGAAIV
mmetsp:Transcript_67747/g.147591  ORF Transcript_67747/g.147591 Transcript_67747/m.147591 type:complete len:240 (-) Transcript_67747:622-1341(-)|eukprot:CAMPEP_0194758244 /NCGR_PEP_ID=MMETSP0323_2-20130528/11565_1 /TAXON_ID=2866 ORGANISM="Crypthecodinium cohnii, Strain Seligo" /NCGR_SAMPLE_ID=MMETSP0323_2 /ASSEMBLY_ACC=CAM_ASM_000346 /LENGTH=239 /DNA_ID=CAMNT_0039678497 /DNA_START=23 /DNA_END=742 /DNA_ORIENTATION=+